MVIGRYISSLHLPAFEIYGQLSPKVVHPACAPLRQRRSGRVAVPPSRDGLSMAKSEAKPLGSMSPLRILAPRRGASKYTNILFINIYLGPIIGSIFYTLEIYRELGSLAACAASWAFRRRSVNARFPFAPHPRGPSAPLSARRGKRPWEPRPCGR